MSQKVYEKYKPSGTEWLGDVPEHWDVKSLRHACRFAYGDSLAAEIREDGDILVYGSNGPVGSHVSANTEKPVIIVGRKGSHGKINYSEKPVFAIDTTYFVDRRTTSNNLRWLRYELESLGLDAISKDSAVPGLSREDAYANIIGVPPLLEQQAIADFLDAKTAVLDQLTAKKRELLERLREQRTAIISRTVTKGLPDVEARAADVDVISRFKDSGVKWFGDVPENWIPISLRRISRRFSGGTPDRGNESFWDEGTIPWINSGAVNQGLITEPSAFISEDGFQNSSAKLVPKGALVMALAGQGKTKGMVAQTGIETTCNQSMAAIVLRESVTPRYFYWLLDSQYLEIRNMAGGEARDGLNLDMLGDIPCLLPPLLEQQAIANYLDRETTRIDHLISRVETALETLGEYRAALITAAVTGRIDVREVA